MVSPEWRSKGGKVGQTVLGEGLGGASTHFESILNRVLKLKFRPKFA